MRFCVTSEVKTNSQNYTEFESYLDPSSNCDIFNLNCCKSLSGGHCEAGRRGWT